MSERIFRPLARIAIGAILVLCVGPPAARSARAASTWHVATSGADTQSCGSTVEPCHSIQAAINRAGTGDTILIAQGTYTYEPAAEVCSGFGTTGVICVVHKSLTLQGGYDAATWQDSDPQARPTLIDGENQRRGAFVARAASNLPQTILTMSGITFVRGRATSIPARGGIDAYNAFGGGIFADLARLVLTDVIFDGNTVVGVASGAGSGGAGSGGGVAMTAGDGLSQFTRVTFRNNLAKGADASVRGGYGIGGGLYSYRTTVLVSDCLFSANRAQGGFTNGIGREASGAQADAQGGALAAQLGSDMTLMRALVVGNTATGGNAPNGSAGGAFGGALFSEGNAAYPTTLRAYDSTIRESQARGGNGINSNSSADGLAWGGGVQTFDSNLVLERVAVINNEALGGAGTSIRGSAGGGGIVAARLEGNSTVDMTNTIVAANHANMGGGTDLRNGGGGGGLWLQGVSATLNHLTVADNATNSSSMQGSGVLLLNDGAATGASVTMRHTIIAGHTSPPQLAALHVKPGNAITLDQGLYTGNAINNNANGSPAPSGTYAGGASMFSGGAAGFVSPGGPNFNYHIGAASAALDRVAPNAALVDMDGQARPFGAKADIGADEYVAYPRRVFIPWVSQPAP